MIIADYNNNYNNYNTNNNRSIHKTYFAWEPRHDSYNYAGRTLIIAISVRGHGNNHANVFAWWRTLGDTTTCLITHRITLPSRNTLSRDVIVHDGGGGVVGRRSKNYVDPRVREIARFPTRTEALVTCSRVIIITSITISLVASGGKKKYIINFTN